MPKYLIEASFEDSIRYIAECEDEEEARERGRQDFLNGVLGSVGPQEVYVEIVQVSDDAVEGDV